MEKVSRHQAYWSELPSELLLKIADNLSRLDTQSFRLVCKTWSKPICLSYLDSKNILSLVFPHSPKQLFRRYNSPWRDHSPVVVAATVFLFQSTLEHNIRPWLFIAEELNPGKLFVSEFLLPIARKTLPEDFPRTLNFSHIRVSQLAAFHRTRFLDKPNDMFCNKKTLTDFNNNRMVLFERRPSHDACPSVADCTAVVLHNEGSMTAIRLKDGEEKSVTRRMEHQIEESMKKFYVTKFDDIVIFKEKIYALDRKCRAFSMDYDTLSLTCLIEKESSLDEVTCSKRKRLAVSSDGQQLYLLGRLRRSVTDKIGFNVYTLNEAEKKWDKVDGIGKDRLLFVTFDGSFFASVKDIPGWEGNCIIFYNGCFASYPKKIVRDDSVLLSVYNFTAGDCQYWASYHSSSNLFWPPPTWLASNTHMSKREEKEDDKSADGKNQAAPARLTNAELIPSSVTCCDGPTVKFEGFDIKSNLVETLQKIWAKHGNLLENSLIHSSDMVARALESLATTVLILEKTSVGSLSESQADYLNSTLTGLQRMGFKVDWLVPYVDKAIQLHKNKPLKELLHRQAKLAEQRSKLNEQLAELDKLENQVKEDVANASKFTPFSQNENLYQPVGWGSP